MIGRRRHFTQTDSREPLIDRIDRVLSRCDMLHQSSLGLAAATTLNLTEVRPASGASHTDDSAQRDQAG
jgi:hypothetical protein